MRAFLLACLLSEGHASVSVTVYNSAALAGTKLFNGSVPNLNAAVASLKPWQSIAIQAELHPPPAVSWALFSIEADAGYVRLWIDDHLIIDRELGRASPGPGPRCQHPGGDIEPLSGYLRFAGANMPTYGVNGLRDFRPVGGDCTRGCNATVCAALCSKFADQGCVGFVTHIGSSWDACDMRMLVGSTASCAKQLENKLGFTSYTKIGAPGCAIDLTFCPHEPSTPAMATYAIPVPFLPALSGEKATFSKVRLELTAGKVAPTFLRLKMNGSVVPDAILSSTVALPEIRYYEERAAAEVGWNTWLSNDMLTHVLLPSGLALSLELHAGSASVSNLGAQGPSCNPEKFPGKHGLHAVRGEYTEVERVTVGGASFKVESATNGIDLLLLITTLAVSTADDAPYVVVKLGVPESFKPRVCHATTSTEHTLSANCPGFPAVHVMPTVAQGVRVSDDSAFLQLPLALVPGGQASLVAGGRASLVAFLRMHVAPHVAVVAAVATARDKLLTSFAKYGKHNETYAGMQTAISWNAIYTPYEGIFTPVFRGSPWLLAQPHNYVLFEWDTYLVSLIAGVTDPWIARSNIIRMTKSLSFKGFVAGFWNGLCGEIDKSKPPVGGIALEQLLKSHPSDLWVAELLLPQFVLWSRWWAETRQFSAAPGGTKNMTVGLLAPGSTRENLYLHIHCNLDRNSVAASRCETGLDNSPLYDGATFVTNQNVIDSVDVGMTALYARDSLALANIARALRLDAFASELEVRGTQTASQLNGVLWNDQEGIYLNKLWQTGEWNANDPKTRGFQVAPTNFYPMLARAPSDAQVERMISRYLANTSEFAVNDKQAYGMPSISRSSSAFHDNSYWRGRAWGPTNMLVYLGLREYDHLLIVQQVMKDLAAQSEATFLVEWVANHRVMENFNSVTGAGCDVGDAIPFYHWGALNALIPLMQYGLVGLDQDQIQGLNATVDMFAKKQVKEPSATMDRFPKVVLAVCVFVLCFVLWLVFHKFYRSGGGYELSDFKDLGEE